ncbi:hypothetical protein [Novosphingobium cyanobacteriorum]|uniref:Autotransporter domain-containing protein n=1 Tax=Novosphingobium cyanobacteriorum TaxID=3024215 RepID=A0ABT6CJQ9_9SPHN|nr:hypothetical protein [Novosphingobium cyanobacteriorum]MDF8334132.1 hypothetical protein [Novosphingobium cyanobacteriorum]
MAATGSNLPKPTVRKRSRKETWTASSLAIAATLAAGAIAAHAQSLQGTGTFTNPANGSIFATLTTTDVTLNSPQSVINWTPTDTSGTGTILFQPNGTTTTFHNNAGSTADFAVLNRVIPVDASGNPVLNRPIRFDGRTVSEIQSAAGGPATRGGTVFFYTPGGIIIGSTSVFDVGNLVLTTSDIPYDAATGNFGSGSTYQFLSAQAGTSVTVEAGAQINSSVGSAANAYVALVAPRIVQDGAISVDGSAALVAADAATIQFSPDGLYNIQVDSGTSATGNVISNSGTITNVASAGGTVVQGIYMVAVPKNTAITMAIAGGSQLGFAVAGGANVVGNTVVLSAGQDIVGGAVGNTASAGGGTGQADIRIGAITSNSALAAVASGNAVVGVGPGETATFGSDLSVAGVVHPGSPDTNAAHVLVSGAGSTMTVAGNLSVISRDAAAVFTGAPSDTSQATLDLNQGSLTVGGSVFISANRSGLTEGASITGGTAYLGLTNGSTLDVTGDLAFTAQGQGGPTSATSANAGSGTGGAVLLAYDGGSTITVGGGITANASGSGGSAFPAGFAGGAGTGGNVTFFGLAGAGALDVGGGVTMTAEGIGGFGNATLPTDQSGGDGTGGAVNFSIQGATAQTITIGGDVNMSVVGAGASANTGLAGNGQGGQATLSLSGGKHGLTVANVFMSAAGSGGSGTDVTAGNGQGGIAFAALDDGAQLTTGILSVTANAQGGDYFSTGAGGTGIGGNAAISIGGNGGGISASIINVEASGTGGLAADSFSGDGSLGRGGTATVSAGAGTLSGQSIFVLASGTGGDGIDNGGAGQGGTAQLLSTGGTIQSSADSSVTAEGKGGFGEVLGGAGTGGNAIISALTGNVTLGGSSPVFVSAAGFGGSAAPFGATGGTGHGGQVQIVANNGSVSFTGGANVGANGAGGVGSNGGNGGGAIGGTVSIDAQSNAAGGSLIALFDSTINVSGVGGAGGDAISPDIAGGNGGNGQGGTLNFNGSTSNGTLSAGTLTVNAFGRGGAGGIGGVDDVGNGFNGGNGGRGQGGTANFTSNGLVGGVAPTGTTTLGALTVDASGNGGAAGAPGVGPGVPANGGSGGNGTGGTIGILAEVGGSTFQVTNDAQLTADGIGASGLGCITCAFDGGAGQGGAIFIGSTTATTGNSISAGNLTLSAISRGGNSLVGVGGAGSGGSLVIAGSGFALNTGTLSMAAVAYGGGAFGTNIAGAAQGGDARINLGTGATLGSTSAALITSAFGGGNADAGGKGGVGTGGVSSFISTGGAASIINGISLQADGNGGLGDFGSPLGIGGDGAGGSVFLSAGSEGAGNSGNGGSITNGGATSISASGFGALGGTGGNGLGGDVLVSASNGSLALQDLTGTANGIGGQGLVGGAGGNGQGGTFVIAALNDLGGAAVINGTTVQVGANGLGGDGGNGISGDGGKGGDGLGGLVSILGAAGNGVLNLGDVTAHARGFGGLGGNGVSVISVGTGGNGGAGGSAVGGGVQVGTQSHVDTGALNTGSASFTSVTVIADGNGGTGGSGGTGPIQGNGGAGGDGSGGGTVLLVRGSPVTINGAGVFFADGAAGFGGVGLVDGAGGDAFVGGPVPTGTSLAAAALVVTNRSGQPTQRGSLVAQDLTFYARALGGLGSTNGTQTDLGNSVRFTLSGADVSATTLSFTSTGTPTLTGPASAIQLQDGLATISGGFSFDTQGSLSLQSANGGLTAAAVNISGGNWIDAGPLAGTPGVLFGTGSVNLVTGQDLIANASFQSGGNLSIGAAGAVALGNLVAAGQINGSAGTTMNLANVTAGGLVGLGATDDLTVGNVSTGSNAFLSSGGVLTTGAIGAADTATIFGDGGVTTGNVTVGNAIAIGSVTSVTTGALSAGLVSPLGSSLATYDITVQSDGAIALGDAQAAGDLAVFGGSSISAGTLGGRDIAVLSTGNQTLGGIGATGRVLLADQSMSSLGGAPFSSTYDLNAVFAAAPVGTAGSITLNGPVTAGQFTAVTLSGFGGQSITAGDAIRIDAGAAGLSAGAIGSAAGSVTLTSGGNIAVDDLAAGSGLSVNATGNLAMGAGTSAAGDVTLFSIGNFAASGPIDAAGGNLSLISAGSVVAGDLHAQGTLGTVALRVQGAATTALGALSADAGDIEVGSVRALSLGNLVAQNGAVALASVGTLDAGSLTVIGGDLQLTSGADTTVGAVSLTNGTLSTTIAGALTGASLTVTGGSLVTLDPTGNLSLGTVQTDGDLVATGVDVSLGAVNAANVVLNAAGTLSTLQINAVNGVDVRAAGILNTGVLSATGDVSASATGNVAIAGIGTDGLVTVSGNALALGNLRGSSVALTSAGTLAAGTVTATTGAVSITAGNGIALNGSLDGATGVTLAAGSGGIAAGFMQSGGAIVATSSGDVSAGAIRATGNVEIASSGGSIGTVNVVAGGNVLLAAGNSLSSNLVVGQDIALLAGQDIIINGPVLSGHFNGTLFTADNGRVLMAGNQMAALGGSPGAFDYDAVFAVAPQRAGGAIRLTGFNAGAFTAASQGSVRIGRSTASQSVYVESGGLVTVAQQWQAPDIAISSADIDILAAPVGASQPGGLNAGVNGKIVLQSGAAGPMLIGDGLTGTGYTLDNGEWSLINSGSLTVQGGSMRIGNLDVTGPDAGSTIDDPNGFVRFRTGPTGSIRITGNVVATGFRPTNALEFLTGQFELDSSTGSLAVQGINGALSGTLRINADHIHVASGTVLDRLANDPFYSGFVQDLDAGSGSPRDGAVLRAGAFDMQVGTTFYVQNTGTFIDPAGLLVPLGTFGISATRSTPITVVLNGRFASSPTDLAGRDAFRAFREGRNDLALFGGESRLNDCLISSIICGETFPDPSFRDKITVLTDPGLEDTPDLVSDDDDGEGQPPAAGDAGGSGPIAPPMPLINTGPLDPLVEIDEPVAGSGNPGLMGLGKGKETPSQGEQK